MSSRKGILFYFDDFRIIEGQVTDAEMGQLFSAAMRYAMDGTTPSSLEENSKLNIAWLVLKRAVDHDNESYDMKCLKSKYAAYCREQRLAGQEPDPFETWHRTISDDIGRCRTISDATNTSTNTNTNAERSARATPTREEVRAYCEAQNLPFDPDYFFDYYEDRHWMTGNTPIRNWKTVAQNWKKQQRQTSSDRARAGMQKHGEPLSPLMAAAVRKAMEDDDEWHLRE